MSKYLTTLCLLASLLTITLLTSCGNENDHSTQREVSEEATELVNAVAPNDVGVPEPSAPAPMIIPEDALSEIQGAGGLLKLGVPAAQTMIDKWIGTLRGNDLIDDSDLLVENLMKLKVELARQPINKDEVGEILENLGRETLQAADDADNLAVKKLGEAISATAEALD